MPEFWRMDSPAYETDYKSSRINGSLDHPYWMPHVRCSNCGATWGDLRVVPVSCPEELRDPKTTGQNRVASLAEYQRLRAVIVDKALEKGEPTDELQPGVMLQPGYLDVPSYPTADFLWSLIGSVVVSERIKDLFQHHGFSGAEFCTVIPRKIGMRRARGPAPVPSSGEPEDLINEVGLLQNTSELPPYYEMVVTADSELPDGVELRSTCQVCGRREYDISNRWLLMKPEMWRGDDVFVFSTTLWIVVTDQVKDVIEKAKATNVRFERIRSEIDHWEFPPLDR